MKETVTHWNSLFRDTVKSPGQHWISLRKICENILYVAQNWQA